LGAKRAFRNLDSEYTQVMLDGMSLASADATQNTNILPSCSLSPAQVPPRSMEAIKICSEVSADSYASVSADTINLRTKPRVRPQRAVRCAPGKRDGGFRRVPPAQALWVQR
jgi:hypothetical protein